MDVTRDNFSAAYADLENAVSSSTFISIDAEFTGLCKPGQEQKVYDTPAQVYEKIRQCAMAYNVIQYGVGVFRYDSNTDKYCVRTYNFNINIRPYEQLDEHYSMQSSSISFLASQNMDFNKIFRDGVSYLLPHDYDRMRNTMDERHQKRLNALTSKPNADGAVSAQSLKSVPDNLKIAIDRNLARVKQMLDNDLDELDLDSGTVYFCRAIIEHIKYNYKDQFHLGFIKEKNDRRSFVRVKRVRTVEDYVRLEKESQQLERDELDEAFGFSNVIRLLYNSKQLIVGHNMYLDLLHTIHHFAHPLPEDYVEFKQLANTLFPQLIDTKHIASSEAFKDLISNTSLADLHSELQKKPFTRIDIEMDDGFDLYTNNERLHEAGYDAYVTGRCFIAMAKYLGKNTSVMSWSPILTSYLNKLHIMRLPDVRFMNISGDDDAMSRNHVFHVAFNRETNCTDLKDLFSPFSGVRVEWLNDTSAFVAINRKEKVEEAKREFMKKKQMPNGFVIQTYDEFVSSNGASPGHLNQSLSVMNAAKNSELSSLVAHTSCVNTSGMSAPPSPARRLSEPMALGSPIDTSMALLHASSFLALETSNGDTKSDVIIKHRITKDKKPMTEHKGPLTKKIRKLDAIATSLTSPTDNLKQLFDEPNDW